MRITIVLPGGSSPLTRGKPVARCSVSGGGWLIPTHAGKTDTAEALVSDRPAHPHSRGENAPGIASPSWFQGSSPLTRGKRTRCPRPHVASGLIPAHAGKTRRRLCRDVQARAHPRSRGENLARLESIHRTVGSSPLTRGKRSPSYLSDWLLGLIPAHAGKTKPRSSPTAPCTAHPRSRGENTAFRLPAASASGSSPLTRGKPPTWTRQQLNTRLIPAHAGKTG